MIRGLFFWLVALLCPAVAAAEEEALRSRQTEHYTFEWQPGLESAANHLMERVEADHDRIYAALGADRSAHSQITLVRDERAMHAIVRARGRGTPPEWAAGLAYPRRREIYLHAAVPRGELETTLEHEIVHVALGVATDDARVPRWFHEGVAIRLSEGTALERVRLLTEAALMDGLIDLDRLDAGFPEGASRAGVAYAQAVHFVGFLRDKYGDERFASLIRTLRDGDVGFEAAIDRNYSESLGAIEDRWRRGLRIWWGWIPVIFGTTTLWAAGAMLLIAAWRRRRGQYRRRLEVLAAEEAVESAPEIHVRAGAAPPSMHDPYDGRPPTIH